MPMKHPNTDAILYLRFGTPQGDVINVAAYRGSSDACAKLLERCPTSAFIGKCEGEKGIARTQSRNGKPAALVKDPHRYIISWLQVVCGMPTFSDKRIMQLDSERCEGCNGFLNLDASKCHGHDKDCSYVIEYMVASEYYPTAPESGIRVHAS